MLNNISNHSLSNMALVNCEPSDNQDASGVSHTQSQGDNRTSTSSHIKALVLETAAGKFYVAAHTPKDAVSTGIGALPGNLAQELRVIRDPHITLMPPSAKLHPRQAVQTTQDNANLQLKFDEITISHAGFVNLRGPKTEAYKRFTESIADAYQEPSQQRDPHSIIGSLSQSTVKNLFNHPQSCGLTLDESREQPLLVKKLDEEIPVEISVPSQRPQMQRLLSLAHGESVMYAKKPLTRDTELEKKYHERQETISQLQSQAVEKFVQGDVPRCPEYRDPVHFNLTALRLAMEGDKQHGRVPLTFSMKAPTISEGVNMWVRFRGETATALTSHGYRDAHVSVLGSTTTGYSGNPSKPIKAWTHNSDIDCAVFSDRLAGELLDKKGWVNTKITMKGKYSVFKNAGDQNLKKIGFYHHPVGKELQHIALKWTTILYGKPGTEKVSLAGRPVETIAPDEIDFKLNIENKPFAGKAITFFAPDYSDQAKTNALAA